jgi:hypothetical protein
MDEDEERPWPGPFRDGGVHVLSRKCVTCIFRPGNLMHLREGAAEDMVEQSLRDQSAITCHKTLTGDVPPSVCRGFYDVHGQKVQALQVAARLDMLVEDEPPTDH